MVKSDSEKEEVPEKLATERQRALILELYEEIDYKRQFDAITLSVLNRDEASKHIHLLKEVKSRDYQLRKHNEKGVDFDKIGFGMVYKLIWRAMSVSNVAVKPSKIDFIDSVCGEYKLFKDAQEACRQFVQDGGLK